MTRISRFWWRSQGPTRHPLTLAVHHTAQNPEVRRRLYNSQRKPSFNHDRGPGSSRVGLGLFHMLGYCELLDSGSTFVLWVQSVVGGAAPLLKCFGARQ